MNLNTRQTSLAYTQEKPVPVIASFSNEGGIRPLYIRIGGESRKVISARVKSDFRNHTEYYCKVVVDNRAIDITLSYYSDLRTWAIPPDVGS